MGKTSNKAKQDWNNAHYTQIKVSIQPGIAAAFKKKCRDKGVSQANEISRLIGGESNAKRTLGVKPDIGTRQQRRKALVSLIVQLENICDAEKQYLDNIPINLQNGERYEAAGQAASMMEEALGALYQAY